MFDTSQDILYITVAVCIGVFTVFLVWIMYYIAQISRQSNEMITDFRQKMEELDETMRWLKEKVNDSVDSLAAVSSQVGTILEMIKSFTGGRTKKRRKSDDE